MNEAERQSRRDSARAWLRRSWRTEEERAALEGLRADVYRRLTGGTRDAESMEQIAREMSYTKRHIARLHREGLDEVAEILERKNS